MVRRRKGELLPLEVDILATGLDLQAEAGFYGFALALELSGDGERRLTAHGTLYKALSRMSEAGLLESRWEDAASAETEGRPRRRLYRVTGAGVRALEAAREPGAAGLREALA